MIDDLVREHVQIRQAMVQLKAGAALAKLIFDFGDLLERHIRREERELFPLFEQQVHGSQAERIGAELKKSLEAKAET
jgi:hemerythrin-like domain-containing protein